MKKVADHHRVVANKYSLYEKPVDERLVIDSIGQRNAFPIKLPAYQNYELIQTKTN